MASRRNPMRPVPRLRDVLERVERNEVKRLLLGMPVADPFLDLDLGTSPDAAGAAPAAVAPFGFAPPASPVRNLRRMPDTLSGGRGEDVLIGGAGSDTLGSLGDTIFEGDPVGGVAFGSLPLRNPQRASGAIIGSGGASPEELVRQDDLVADEDEILDGRPVILPGFKTQRQREGMNASARRRRADTQKTRQEKADRPAVLEEKARQREAARKKSDQQTFEDALQRTSIPLSEFQERMDRLLQRRQDLLDQSRLEEEQQRLVSFDSSVPDSRMLPEAVEDVRKLLKRAGVTMPLKSNEPTPDVKDAFLLNKAIGIGDETDAARADRLQRLFPRERVRFGFDRFGNIVFSLDGQLMTFNRSGRSPQDARDLTVDALTSIGTTAVAPLLSLSQNAFLTAADTARMFAPPASPAKIGGRSQEEIAAMAVGRGSNFETEDFVPALGDGRLFETFNDALIDAIRRAVTRAENGRLRKADRDALSRIGIRTDILEDVIRRGLSIEGLDRVRPIKEQRKRIDRALRRRKKMLKRSAN